MSIECESGEAALPPHLRSFFTSPDPLIAHDGQARDGRLF